MFTMRFIISLHPIIVLRAVALVRWSNHQFYYKSIYILYLYYILYTYIYTSDYKTTFLFKKPHIFLLQIVLNK